VSGRLYVGAISGTSVDGLDLALLSTDAPLSVLHARTTPLPESLRRELLALGQPGNDDLDRLGAADRQLGRFIGEAINGFLTATGTDPGRVRAIGSHGQTVRHRPRGREPFSWQIGDPNQIAEITGITTIADFRRRDMAAGGEGAPLVPPFHAALFRTREEDRGVLNIGGIANLTVLPADPASPVEGFDTGPGNGLMDQWVLRERGLPFDNGGAWAATGQVRATLLEALLQEDYLRHPPPKSTGREHFNLDWLMKHDNASAGSAADIQATLCAYTAQTVADALQRWAPHTRRLLVCGGGRLNATLMQALASRTGLLVEPTDAHGVDGDSVEAAAFAWLASQTVQGRPGNEPAVTGASGHRVLGAIYQA
jgi:anhydro-N-acetylmuramic acid kinase